MVWATRTRRAEEPALVSSSPATPRVLLPQTQWVQSIAPLLESNP